MILLSSTFIFAQGLKLGLSGGISSFQAPDYYTEKISDGGLGLGSELHIGGKAKLSLPVLPLKIVGSVYYTMLGSEDSGIEISGSILSLGVGGEWKLIPGPLAPYLALDINFNSFGEMETKVNSSTFKSDSFSRVGLGVGLGAEFTLLPKVDVDISAKYHFYNLLGKEEIDLGNSLTSDEKSITALMFSATFMFSLL